MNFTGTFSINISYYLIRISFLIFLTNYQLKKPQWSDQYSVHKINPDIHLMCELHVIVKLYRAACSLYDAVSHFFLNSSSCSLLNVCSNNREQTQGTFEYQTKKAADLSTSLFQADIELMNSPHYAHRLEIQLRSTAYSCLSCCSCCEAGVGSPHYLYYQTHIPW